jgi:hypothetical protein
MINALTAAAFQLYQKDVAATLGSTSLPACCHFVLLGLLPRNCIGGDNQ